MNDFNLKKFSRYHDAGDRYRSFAVNFDREDEFFLLPTIAVWTTLNRMLYFRIVMIFVTWFNRSICFSWFLRRRS